jgi:hypothetical protein
MTNGIAILGARSESRRSLLLTRRTKSPLRATRLWYIRVPPLSTATVRAPQRHPNGSPEMDAALTLRGSDSESWESEAPPSMNAPFSPP